MKLAYEINLFIHAAAGLLALAVLAIPLIAKKGGRVHRRSGWVFTAAMVVVTLTGLALALAWLLAPLVVKPLTGDPTPAQIAGVVRQYRAYSLFFGTLALLSGSSVWQGISAVLLKDQRSSMRGRWFGVFDHVAWAAPTLTGLGLLVLGLARGVPLFMAFGGLAAFIGISSLRVLLRPPDRKGAWLIRHLQAMLGGATVAVTAFTVLVLRRYLDTDAGFDLVYWLVPVGFGVFGSVVWTRIYERRLGYGRGHAAR